MTPRFSTVTDSPPRSEASRWLVQTAAAEKEKKKLAKCACKVSLFLKNVVFK